MGTGIAVFKDSRVRKTLHQNEWWFSVSDICGILTESAGGEMYWRELKQKLSDEGCEGRYKLEKQIQEDWEKIL